MSEEEAERWEEIKRTFGRNQYLQGGDQNDPVSRVVSQLSLFSGGLESIQDTLKEELSKDRTTTIDTSALSADLENLAKPWQRILLTLQSQEAKVRRLRFHPIRWKRLAGRLRNTWSNPVRRPQRRKGISRCWPNANRP